MLLQNGYFLLLILLDISQSLCVLAEILDYSSLHSLQQYHILLFCWIWLYSIRERGVHSRCNHLWQLWLSQHIHSISWPNIHVSEWMGKRQEHLEHRSFPFSNYLICPSSIYMKLNYMECCFWISSWASARNASLSLRVLINVVYLESIHWPRFFSSMISFMSLWHFSSCSVALSSNSWNKTFYLLNSVGSWDLVSLSLKLK